MTRRTPTNIKNRSANAHGFTMIELMTVLAIIGVMSAIAVQAFTKNVRRARKSEIVADLSTIVLRQNAALALRGRYVSTATSEDPGTLYPTHAAFLNSGNPKEVVAWNVADPAYTMAGAGNAGNFLGGGNYHGWDALNFMPEGGVSRCGYATIAGVGSTGRNDDGVNVSVIPQAGGMAAEVFPVLRPTLYQRDWFWAIARCDLDYDSEFWDFTVTHYDTNVVDADIDGVRAAY